MRLRIGFYSDEYHPYFLNQQKTLVNSGKIKSIERIFLLPDLRLLDNDKIKNLLNDFCSVGTVYYIKRQNHKKRDDYLIINEELLVKFKHPSDDHETHTGFERLVIDQDSILQKINEFERLKATNSTKQYQPSDVSSIPERETTVPPSLPPAVPVSSSL